MFLKVMVMIGDSMEIIYLALFNMAFTIMGLGWIFKYFDEVFNAQADLIDRIIKNSNIRFSNIIEEGTIIEPIVDEHRTHILGGVVDHGTHTTGVCHPDCWCNVSKGEEE